MNWFQQNRFLGIFLGAFALATLLAGYFLLHEKGAADLQEARLQRTINELTRLRRSRPFPNEENLQKTKTETDSYRSSLLALENELKARTLPIAPIQPNEFQAQLRQSVNAVIESARANADHNHNYKADTLQIVSIQVSPGPRFKRYRPAAHGRALPYQRRTSHIHVVVDGEQRAAKKPATNKKEAK